MNNIMFSLSLLQFLQPSSGVCVCQARYFEGRSADCGRLVYPACEENFFRSQDGACLSQVQWEAFCQTQGCRSPDLYVGFNSDLGVCNCKVSSNFNCDSLYIVITITILMYCLIEPSTG